MNGEQAILSRRSCRKFQHKEVPRELIEKLILAGRSALTGLDRQKLRFYVIANDFQRIHETSKKFYKNLTKDGKKETGLMILEKDMKSKILFFMMPLVLLQ